MYMAAGSIIYPRSVGAIRMAVKFDPYRLNLSPYPSSSRTDRHPETRLQSSPRAD